MLYRVKRLKFLGNGSGYAISLDSFWAYLLVSHFLDGDVCIHYFARMVCMLYVRDLVYIINL